jgi:rod shape-determining protein MreC
VNAILRDPPAFFNRGPSPLARFTFFSLICVAAMIADYHFGALNSVRFGIAAVVEPLQRAAAWPVTQVGDIGRYFGEQSKLVAENEALKLKLTDYAREAQATRQLQTDQYQLLGLQTLKSKYSNLGIVTEVLYTTKLTGNSSLIIDKGATSGLKAGMAVIDSDGVIGQVIRVGPTTSELSLITQKDQPVPVMVARNNLRAITVGIGRENVLEMPYLPIAADIREGDILLTSGIDGTYPPGLSVGKVSRVEKSGGVMFAKISLVPSAGVDRNRFLLVLTTNPKDSLPKVDVKEEATETAKQSRAANLAERRRKNVGG